MDSPEKSKATNITYLELPVKVAIRNELKRAMPIKGLKSRLGTIEVLAYVGNTHEVLPILQQLNHTSRAYTENTNGLKGFCRREPEVLFAEIAWAAQL